MAKVELVSYADLEKVCGPPGEPHSLVKIKAPFPLKLSWEPGTTVTTLTVNERIAEPLIEVFQDILYCYGLPFIQEHGLDLYGGCFNKRKSRGSDRWSVHAWGMAVDYCPQLGAYGAPPLMPWKIVQYFGVHGFLWGGRWEHPDGMHFTASIE